MPLRAATGWVGQEYDEWAGSSRLTSLDEAGLLLLDAGYTQTPDRASSRTNRVTMRFEGLNTRLPKLCALACAVTTTSEPSPI